MRDANKKALAVIVQDQKTDSFTDPASASGTDALGLVIAHYCSWDSSIIDVFMAALEDANFHAFYELIEATRDLEPDQIRALAQNLPAALDAVGAPVPTLI